MTDCPDNHTRLGIYHDGNKSPDRLGLSSPCTGAKLAYKPSWTDLSWWLGVRYQATERRYLITLSTSGSKSIGDTLSTNGMHYYPYDHLYLNRYGASPTIGANCCKALEISPQLSSNCSTLSIG